MFSEASEKITPITNNLSAIGSKIFPKLETTLYFLAKLQIYMNTTKINSKIGVIKDENNNLISSSYSTENRNYSADIITITADDLFYDISVNHIKHLGAFNSYYSNFIEDINNFFGIGAFDPTIFSNTYKPPLDLSNNVIEYKS